MWNLIGLKTQRLTINKTISFFQTNLIYLSHQNILITIKKIKQFIKDNKITLDKMIPFSICVDVGLWMMMWLKFGLVV